MMRTTHTRLFQNACTVALLAAMSIALVACSESSTSKASAPPTPDVNTVEGVIEMSRVVFVGDQRPEAIKGKMQAAMKLYGLSETPADYLSAANTLVYLRQQTGETEMAILDYMIKSYVPGVNAKFDSTAELSARFLQFGDRAR
jgi:hypothetical protein